jgi:Transposase DDE domain
LRIVIPKCRPSTSPGNRTVNTERRGTVDLAQEVQAEWAFERSRHDKNRVEMLFAHLKRILRLGRLRLRGPCGAQFEFTLAAIAQNLRRLAKFVARPPPLPASCVAADYYNDVRTHRSLDKDAPFSRPVQRIGRITSHTLLGGLHHHYCRI